MPFAPAASIAACFAVFAASALGLNAGIVLHSDHHGHLSLEHAYLHHAFSHAQGADHPHHDYGGDADHSQLHAALESSASAEVGQTKSSLAVDDTSHLADLPPVPRLFGQDAANHPPDLPPRRSAADCRATGARAQLDGMSAIVLIV